MSRRVVIVSCLFAVGLVSPVRAQVKLEVKYPEQTTSTYQSTVRLRQVLSLMGADIETRSEEATTVRQTVGERRPDGTLPIVRTIDAVKARVELPGGLMVAFDSAEPDANKPENPALQTLWTLLRSLTGVRYTIVLDRDGRVSAVEGTEALLEKAGDLDPMTRDELKARFTPERLTESAKQARGLVPDGPVRQGDHWERTEVMSISGGQSLTFTRRYEYLGTTRDGDQTLDRIGVRAVTVRYALDPSPGTPIQVVKSDLEIASSDGTILFDREAGRIVRLQEKTRIKGDMTLEISGAEQPAKLDLTIEVDQRLKMP